MRLRILLAALALSPACGGRLVPNYEVLATPVGSEAYTPGRQWIDGLGPDGEPRGEVVASPGAAQLKTSSRVDAEASIAGVFEELIAAGLGLERQQVTDLELTDLTHHHVADLYGTAVRGRMLWETITASGMELTVTADTSGGGSVDASKLGSVLPQVPLELTASADVAQGTSYTVTSDQPLVVAIRVVDIGYDQRSVDKPIPLDGGSASVGMGYQVTPLDPPSAATGGEIRVRISNPDLVQWVGEEVVLRHGEPWASTAGKQSIGAADPRARRADYVWDTLMLTWTGGEARVRATRQYVELKPARSGLKGTR